MDPDVDARKRLRCWLTIATGVLVDLTDLSPEGRMLLREKGERRIDDLSVDEAEEILADCEGYVDAPWG